MSQEQRFESPTGDRAGPNPEQLNLVILGDAGTKVVLQYSDDLMFWEAIGGEIPIQEGKFTLSILEDGKQLFYRVLKPGE